MSESKGLLVLRVPQALTQESVDKLTDYISPIAEQLSLEPLVLTSGADARIEQGSQALMERLCVAVERLVAQGEPPALEQLDEPVMPRGLNSRG